MKDFPDHEKPKDHIQSVAMPVERRIQECTRTREPSKVGNEADKNGGIADHKPDYVSEKKRICTPQRLAQQKQKRAHFKHYGRNAYQQRYNHRDRSIHEPGLLEGAYTPPLLCNA